MSGDNKSTPKKNYKGPSRKGYSGLRYLKVLVVIGVISLTIGGFLYIKNKNQCQDVAGEAKKMIEVKKYQEAMDILSKHETCGKANNQRDNLQVNKDAVNYNRYKALALYGSGDTDGARRSAERALEVYATIPDSQKATAIPDNYELLDSMSDITEDFGDPLR